RFDRVPALLGLLLRFGQLRGHRIERLGEDTELVTALHRMPAAEVALRDSARALGQKTQRSAHLTGEHDGEPERGKKREQQRQGQRESIKALQRNAGKRYLLVVAVAGLHFLGIELQLP